MYVMIIATITYHHHPEV